jgi:hypothetical protein
MTDVPVSGDNPPRFAREQVRAFRFVHARFDPATGEARLAYAFDDDAPMVETLRFPGAPFTLDAARTQAVQRALHLLHLVAGVSYYKAAVPPAITIDGYAIDADTAALLTDVYEHGLGEFAYCNGLSLRGKVRFPVADPVALVASAAGLSSRALVAIGGGKDSLVSIEALRAAGVAATVAWIGSSQLIAACGQRTGLPLLNIGRELAPALFDLNRRGALNGHIPVTAINSAILVLAALLYGCDQVVFSNERSASYGSLIPGTGEVNHQWSKGWAFERAFGEYVQRRIATDLHYYSLLRPWSELAVARQFARLDHYDAHFSSCNRNFHLLGARPASRWCGQCPKCRFVFLALAPFMPKPRLVGIFGRNLLDEPGQEAGYDALIEYRDHKPFECVGEGSESRAAFAALTQSPAWREDALVQRFASEIRPTLDPGELALAPLLRPQGPQRLPANLLEPMYAHFGT